MTGIGILVVSKERGLSIIECLVFSAVIVGHTFKAGQLCIFFYILLKYHDVTNN